MKKQIKFGAIALGLVAVIVIIVIITKHNGSEQKFKMASPVKQDIELTVSTVGTVKPQNRLQIKPPINGRVERILVDEGHKVKVGEVLAFMSSMERATLIDAARLQGNSEFKYWQDAYKETPLVSPIDGIVIVRNVEPGQTVTTSEAIIVISDRLIVEADVDETDIGEVKTGQTATIKLDAYPEIKIPAKVDDISYESQIVNNVTIYKVDILPETVPEVFRSGMSANVDIVVKNIKDALLVPTEALTNKKGEMFVNIKNGGNSSQKTVPVKIGIQKNGFTEIVSGISESDVIFTPEVSYTASKQNGSGGSPFFPQRKSKEETNK